MQLQVHLPTMEIYRMNGTLLKFGIASAALSISLVAVKPAAAAFVNAPVPDNATINFAGLQWAWANPCAPSQPTCGEIDLSYQSQFGWRLPTLAELLAGPAATDFLFAGANVPQGGTDPISGATFLGGNPGAAAAAVPYFSNNYYHADWGDGVVGFWAGLPSQVENGAADTLVVRNAIGAESVPEPFTIIGTLVGGSAALRMRKKLKSDKA
jgi:hypothetical protein